MNPFLEAVRAGLSPIPVDVSSKRPLVRWAQYQDHPADIDELTEWGRWFAAGRCGIGFVCGSVSGRLVAIDIEGRFIEHLPELAQRLRQADCFGLFESWVDGYAESTPSGGLHVLVRVGGDDRVEGNTKLAVAADGHPLIETRGEGGFVVVAPSANASAAWVRLTGGFDRIAWATADEWAAVAAVLASFDESSRGRPAPPLSTAPPSTPAILRLTDSWIDEAKAALGSMADVLTAAGWTRARSADGYGQHWVRPDKDPREGHSASVNHESDRLWVHSTAAGLPTGVSMDVVDVVFALDRHRMPSNDERVEVLRAHRPPSVGGAAGPAAEAGPASARKAVPGVDDDSVRLDDAFWQSTRWLKALRAAAWSRGLAPSGVLGAFLSTFATTVPSGIWVPAVWGSRAPLNTYCCLVGQSGSGKTASMHLALDLCGPVANRDVLLGRSLRSGEGLINLATKRPAKKASSSQLDLGEPAYRNAVQITFDEGSALGRQAERSGATVIPYLNTAWAGYGVVGGAKASEHGSFPADLVRVCCVIGIQFGAADNLFTGESARLGFPQRLLFFGLRDAELLDHDVDEMSMEPVRALDLPELAWSDHVRHPTYVEVPAHIEREVRLWTQDKEHGAGLTDPLDGHMMQLRLRVAALLAIIGGEFAIGDLEWNLGRQICDYSRRIRAQLLTALGDVVLEKARALGREDVVREDVREDAWLRRRARRIATFLQNWGDDGASMKEIKNRLDSSERIRRDEILAYAVAKGWVIHRDGRFFPRGEK